MNPFGYHYPAGAESDPRAPWNQRDVEACDSCDGTGRVSCTDCRGEDCQKCDAEGFNPCCDCNGTGEEGNQK